MALMENIRPRRVAKWLPLLCLVILAPGVLILWAIWFRETAESATSFRSSHARIKPGVHLEFETLVEGATTWEKLQGELQGLWHERAVRDARRVPYGIAFCAETTTVRTALTNYWAGRGGFVRMAKDLPDTTIRVCTNSFNPKAFTRYIESVLASNSVILIHKGADRVMAVPASAVELNPH